MVLFLVTAQVVLCGEGTVTNIAYIFTSTMHTSVLFQGRRSGETLITYFTFEFVRVKHLVFSEQSFGSEFLPARIALCLSATTDVPSPFLSVFHFLAASTR